MKYLIASIVLALLALGAWFYFLGGEADIEPTSDVPRNNARDFEPGQAENPVPGVAVTVPDEPATSSATGTTDSVETPPSNTAADEDTETQTKTFDLTGRNFAFSQTELRVQEGDTVTINFSSTDGTHDWVIDAFDAATERVTAGESTSVTFVATQTGEFEFYCSVGSHRELGMVGTLIVEEPEET